MCFSHRRKFEMKIGKCKSLIGLAVVLAFLVGMTYLFLQVSGAQQPEAEKLERGFPSTGTTPTEAPSIIASSPTPPEPPEKPAEPAHREPAPKYAASARGAYPLSTTAAAKPDKVEGYRPPQYSYEGVLVQEGGETCEDAYDIGSVPFNSTGYTCDNIDDYEETGVFDCPYSSTSPDVVYSYTPSANEVINIDLYGSSYDTKVFVYENICESQYLVACNDDYYPDYVSAIFGLDIYGGNTYYIVVDGYGGDCGDYLIDITYYEECDVVCPPGGVDEGEPVCYDDYVDETNGGCNWSPFVFQPINCGDTICGTSGVYSFGTSTYREMDWFTLDLAGPATITWSGVGEFPVALWILDAGSEDCSDMVTLAFNSTIPCDTLSISVDVPAGVYWFIIAPADWGDYPCGVEYVAWLDCDVVTTGACCNDFEPYDCQITTPEDCAALPDHTFKGLGTDCDPNPCLPAPPNDECEGAIEVFPPDCPSVHTEYGTTVGATIDCPGVLDWEAVWYKFTLTYDCNNVLIDYCPTNRSDVYTRGVVLYDECPPDCGNYILYTGLQWVTCPSTYTDLTVWWNALPAGTYYLPVFVEDNAGNQLDFGFDICVEECFAEPGDNCADPITVTLPAELPYSDLNQTTCGRLDDYSSTCLGYYDGGEDIIYELTVTSAVDVDITMNPKGTTWTGMAIDGACPPGATCMDYSTGSSGSRVLSGVHLEPGTYYIMVDTWPSPTCIPDFDLTITEAAGPPPNDDCANATAIGEVIEIPFSTTQATFDGPGGCQTAPNIWYCYTAPLTGEAHVALCGSYYDTKLAVYAGCECDPVGTMLGCNDDACYKALQSELTIPVVEGNQYLIEVGGYSSNTGDGVLTCTSYVAGEPPENDNCEGAPIISTFPTTVYGTTVDATIDCPGVLDWDAVWYRFDLPYTSNNVLVDFCPTDGYIITVGVVFYDECPPDCPNYILRTGYQWVYCEETGYDNPNIWWDELPGPASYWFPVYVEPGKGAMDFGFTVSVEEALPCTVACPEGGIPEGEPYCYDGYVDTYNAGCNNVPYVFQDINCGDTICGTSGVYDDLYYRDTDWFRVEVGDGDLTWTCVAEFPVLIFIIDAGSENCADYTILGSATAPKCDTVSLSFYVPAGVYWLWVGPSDWLPTIPCGELSEYVAWAECTPFGPQIAVDPTSMYPVLNPSGDCSTADEDLVISSVGGEDLNYSIVENPEVDWMELSSYSGTIPPGNSHTLTTSFDATGMAEGDYYCDLEITHNDPGMPSPFVVAVHLEVELAPEIDIPPRVWMPVVPGCIMDYGFRVHNYGEGELRFEVSVQKNPPPLMARKDDAWENPLQAQWSEAKHRTRDVSQVDMSSPAHLTTLEPSGPSMSPPAGGQVMAEGDTLFMQMVHGPDESWSFATSDNGPGYKVYENFWGVTAPIGDIHFWGFALYYDAGWYLGDPADLVFEITFYSDPIDEIQPPTEVVCTYSNVVPSYEYYDIYAGWVDCWYFSVDELEPACELSEGWVSIQSQSGGQGAGYTWLLWGSAQTGDGVSCQEGGDCPRYFDQAMILTEGGAACPFTVAPESGTVPAESFFDVFLTFDGTLFENCVDDTQTCYMVFTSNDCDEPVLTVDVHAMSARGDVTGDCVINIADLVSLLNYIFKGCPAPDPLCIGDVDRDGDVDSDDCLYMASYLFTGGPPPDIPTAPMEDQTPIQQK
jgi:hypothetical protein